MTIQSNFGLNLFLVKIFFSFKLKQISELVFIIFISIIAVVSTSSSRMNLPSEIIGGNMISNLSCFVCTTIDDINCKYLNETINRHRIDGEHMIRLESDDPYSNHHYTNDGQSVSDMYGSNEATDQTSNLQNNAANRFPSIDSNLMTQFRADCLPDEQYCVVIRLGVSAPDNVQAFNFFALKRSCAEQCTDGCFIIGNGEKTKLSICATCCTTNYCNFGNFGMATFNSSKWCIISLLLILAIIITV